MYPIVKKYALVVTLGAVAAVVHQHPANAHSGTQEEQEACTPDVLRLCLFEIPNEDRIVACLNRKIDSLSPECRKVIAGDSKPKKAR